MGKYDPLPGSENIEAWARTRGYGLRRTTPPARRAAKQLVVAACYSLSAQGREVSLSLAPIEGEVDAKLISDAVAFCDNPQKQKGEAAKHFSALSRAIKEDVFTPSGVPALSVKILSRGFKRQIGPKEYVACSALEYWTAKASTFPFHKEPQAGFIARLEKLAVKERLQIPSDEAAMITKAIMTYQLQDTEEMNQRRIMGDERDYSFEFDSQPKATTLWVERTL